MINQKAAYHAYQLVENAEAQCEQSTEEVTDWYFAMEDLEGSMLSKTRELMSLSYTFEPEYARDMMILLGEMTYIIREAEQKEVHTDSVFRSLKERIIFLAGGDIRVWVNVYENTRHYGGPEEGGWWYDWMELKEGHNVSFKEADEKVESLKEEYGTGEGNISSVLGGYEIYVYIEGSRGESQDTVRPHYE